MFKKIIFITCFSFSFLTANEQLNFSNNNNFIGRYQITANDKELYLLETDTGRIWVAQRMQAKDISQLYPNKWKLLKTVLPTE